MFMVSQQETGISTLTQFEHPIINFQKITEMHTHVQ